MTYMLHARTRITADADPSTLRRCCPSHADLPTLLDHLLTDYPEVSQPRVEFELRRAEDAAALVGLSDDLVETVELLTRSQLSLFTGARNDAARLRPQRTSGRR